MLLSSIKMNLEFIEQAIEGGFVQPFEVVEEMSPSLRDILGGVLYAHSANQDAITDEVEGEDAI